MYDCLHFMTISYPIVMVQALLWVMVEWSDVNVVQDHVCHMKLRAVITVAVICFRRRIIP